MATGVLIFEGMKVGVLSGDFTISIDESGSGNSNIILSTAYNVLPIWLRIARDNLIQTKKASDNTAEQWGENEKENKELLISELEPALQVFVSCGIALDALYDQLRPYAKITELDIEKWRNNGTGRAKQIAEVIRRVYNLKKEVFKQFKINISEIIKYRDLAVHPSQKLKNSCDRPDIPVGVDWKFSAYRFLNSEICFNSTMQMLIYLYENKCKEKNVNEQMENVFKALQELKVVKLNT